MVEKRITAFSDGSEGSVVNGDGRVVDGDGSGEI